MALERAENLTVEQLQEVRDRPLTESYKTHDVGYDIIVARLEAHGFHVTDYGDDARHADEVFWGDGPDLAVYRVRDDVRVNRDGLGSTYISALTGQFVTPEDALEQVAYIEIKCKEDEEWFGRCNYRHYREYVNVANEVDVPVFIWFALVDTDTGALHRDAFFEVEDTDQIEGEVYDVTDEEVVFYEEDVYEVGDSSSDESPDRDDSSKKNREVNGGLLAVDGDDIVGVRSDQQIVDGVPNVHGNDVVCLNEDQLRSFPHFLSVVSDD